jgi:hypothetical protein
MSLNHISNKYLHGNFASLKINDVAVGTGGGGKQSAYFSATLSTQGVNYLNAFSKGSGGSADVLTQFPPLKNVKITGLYVNRKNPNPNVDVILQKANLNLVNYVDLHTLTLVPGTTIDQIHTLNIPVASTNTILVKTQSSGTGNAEDVQVIVIYEQV